MDANANPLDDGLRILARIIARDIARQRMKDQAVEHQVRQEPTIDATVLHPVVAA